MKGGADSIKEGDKGEEGRERETVREGDERKEEGKEN